MTAIGRAVASAPSDIRSLIVSRVMPGWQDRYESIDQLTQADVREIMLDLLAESQRVIDQITAHQDELARLAARAGATHEQRGVAVGLGKEAARRRWPWAATK